MFAIVSTLFELLNPKIVAFVIDSVIGNIPPRLPAPLARALSALGGVVRLREHLWAVALAIVALAALGAAARYAHRTLNAAAAERFVARMRNLLFGHIARLPCAWHAANRTGEVIQRSTQDVETVKRFVADQTTALFHVTLLLVLAFVFMARMNTRLTLVAGLFLPLIIAYSAFFHRKIAEGFEVAENREGEISAMVQENLAGARVVRAFGQEGAERNRFVAASAACCELWVRFARTIGLFWSFGDLLSGLQVMTVVTLGAAAAVHGTMTAGDYIAFVAYNAMLVWPIRSLGRIISELGKAGVSLGRILHIMGAEEERDRPGAVEPPMDRDIAFSHVTFSYAPDGPKILDDVSFTVRAGTAFGILGGSGSGKSTVAQLLARLYELPEGGGRITVGGVDLAHMRAEWVRRNVGLVLQEPTLFSRTLAENIAMGREGVAEEEIREAVREAALEETAARFADGLGTFVGERGVTLSGGQKQRAAIAQTLVRRTPVVVFDDSLSAVDAETDARIRKALLERRRGATTIFISHRIQTLMRCDRILVLDHGRVREQGTHEELLALGGVYRRIHDIQTDPDGAGKEAAHG